MYKLILSIALIVLCQSPSMARACAKPKTVANFNYERFNGTWYSIEAIPNIFERGLRCQQTTDRADTKVKGQFHVQDAGIRDGIILRNTIVTSDSTLVTPDEAQPGLMQNVGPGGLVRMPFYIMDTDYDTYAVTYSCATLLNIESAWILSRKRTLDEKIVEKAKALFAEYKVDVKKFEKSKQTECDQLDKHTL